MGFSITRQRPEGQEGILMVDPGADDRYGQDPLAHPYARRMDQELVLTNIELRERIKELNCIYAITDILEVEKKDMDKALNEIVRVLPPAWKYNDSACARIMIRDREYKTENFRETEWALIQNLSVDGKDAGSVEVRYLISLPNEDIGPFLKEEEKLLRVVAERIGKYIQQFHIDRELQGYRDQLRNLLAGEGGGFEHLMDIRTGKEEDWQLILDILSKTNPTTLFRMSRKMMYYMSHNMNESFDGLMQLLHPGMEEDEGGVGVNEPYPRADLKTLERVQLGIFEIARTKLSPQQIMELLTLWLKQNKVRPLLLASDKPGVTLREIRDVLYRYMGIPEGERILSPEDDRSIRTNLIRRFLIERPEFLTVATRYLKIEDFAELLRDLIGPPGGLGTLGGKASMVFLVERIIRREMGANPELKDIKFARSWYLSTDSMREFIRYNALDEVAQTKYLDPNEIRNEQPFLEQVFKHGAFPVDIANELRTIVRTVRDKPLVIRSSSHLEDSFGAAFSGKYKSLFIANTGNEELRLRSLMDAVAEVWASTFGPNPVEYRRERSMIDLQENMGVLIQEVVGTRIGPYYLPSFAGVAMSNNEFRWSPRINREDGIVRLVMGLGTRAVDRVANDYPELISPNRPEIRVNNNAEEALQYSQRYMDVINMDTCSLETVTISDVLKRYGDHYPMLNRIVSLYRDGSLMTPTGMLLDTGGEELVVTFNGVIEKTPFIKQMRAVMSLLKDRFNTPVDIEFAHDGNHLYILQCRPQSQGRLTKRVPLPANIPKNQVLFTANRYVTTGYLSNIDYIVYIDPEGYESLSTREQMMQVAKVVSELNMTLDKRKFILMGPGRWGSRGDIKLGVPVQYRDINNTALLIEVARQKGGYVPELSFGTHFFQDLVEANIQYLPLYPDEGGTVFNEQLLRISENRIRNHVEWVDELESVIRLVRVPDLSAGGSLTIVMDGDLNEAMAYLVPPDHSQWRMRKLEEMVSDLDPNVFAVEAIYIVGSTKEYTAGPASDIDIIVHFKGSDEQKDRLMGFLNEWSRRIDEENAVRTGIHTGGLLDIHIVTDMDIAEKTSWATHITSLYNPAKKVPIRKE